MMVMSKKNQLMATARKLFAQNGFYGTPTAKIAKDAGVSNGILFHYFPTKDHLIKAMYFDVKESIYTLWLAAVEWYVENPEDFNFMLQFETSPYYSVETEVSHRHTQLTIELMEKGLEQGVFKNIQPFLLFQIMMKMVETTVQYLQLNSELQEDFAFRNGLFEVAWDAVKK